MYPNEIEAKRKGVIWGVWRIREDLGRVGGNHNQNILNKKYCHKITSLYNFSLKCLEKPSVCIRKVITYL